MGQTNKSQSARRSLAPPAVVSAFASQRRSADHEPRTPHRARTPNPKEARLQIAKRLQSRVRSREPMPLAPSRLSSPLGVLQRQLRQETKKCIITGSEKPHHALPRCCCGGSRSLADRWARDGPASYRLRIFISHTASPKSTFSTTRSHPYAYCEHRALYGLNQRVLLDTQRLYEWVSSLQTLPN